MAEGQCADQSTEGRFRRYDGTVQAAASIFGEALVMAQAFDVEMSVATWTVTTSVQAPFELTGFSASHSAGFMVTPGGSANTWTITGADLTDVVCVLDGTLTLVLCPSSASATFAHRWWRWRR